MKKNRILIPALSILALGVAGAASSTFAWYSATRSATVTALADDGHTISTTASAAEDVSYDVKVSWIGTPTAVQLTGRDGNTYVLVNTYTDTGDNNKVKGTVALGNQTGTKYGSLTAGTDNANWQVEVFNHGESTALSGADLNVALSDLKAKGGSFSISAEASGRTRIADSASCFNVDLEETISSVGSLSFASGAAVLTISKTVYYSISGNTGNTTPTVGSIEEVETAESVQGNINIKLTYNAPQA